MRGAVETVAVARDVASSSPSKPAAALDMMRFQRSNPDCLPLPNGIGSGSGSGGTRKPQPPAPSVHRSSKDEVAPAVATDSSRLAAYLASTSLEPKQRARAPQPPAPAAPSSSVAATVTRSPARDHGHHPSDFSDPSSSSYLGGGGGGGSGASSGSASPAAGGEVLLQWGHNKRTRGRRDAPAGSASPLRQQPGAKIPRRSSAPDKLMPPPSGPSYTRGSNLRVGSSPPTRGGDAHQGRGSVPHHRSAEERAGAKSKAEKQRAHAAGPMMGLVAPNQKQIQQAAADHRHHQQQQHPSAAASSSKPKLEVPRIYTTLSRKEKEEDFLVMKGTKLPVRPKKRPKTVEKAVNFICPGMWLTDVTRNRYEVREKKCPKKQRNRGLKGMESMDSDSD